MNKKKLYDSIMESISRQIKKAINETMDFNTSNIFNKEESQYNNSNIVDNYIYKNIDYKIQNDEPITEEESIYYFKIKQKIPEKILEKILYGKKGSNEIIKGLLENNLKYKVKNKTELREIIENYSKKNPTVSLNWIDTSKIKNMQKLFTKTKYNGDISEWDVSHVTNMEGMFYYAESFNQPIGNWNVSHVTDMGFMFGGAKLFNQYIGNWNVSRVTNMSGMFNGAISFNQSIRDWDISHVTNMWGMFNDARSFNQNISKWKLNLIVYTRYMFDDCPIKKEYKPKNI